MWRIDDASVNGVDLIGKDCRMIANQLTAENFTADFDSQSEMCKTLPAWINYFFEGRPDSTLARLEDAALEYCGAIPRNDHCSHECYVHCSAEQLADAWHRVILLAATHVVDSPPQKISADIDQCSCILSVLAELLRAIAYVSPLVARHTAIPSLN
jgi:hypothetical protein